MQADRDLGKDIIHVFSAPPYGWDPNATRVGMAALVRSGAVKILMNKKPYTNPNDRELIDALRVSRNFDRVELVLEVAEVAPDVLTQTRSFLMNLARRRDIDETPAALSEAAGKLAEYILAKADTVKLWSAGAGMPLSCLFVEGEEAWQKIKGLSNPVHRVLEIHGSQGLLEKGYREIEQYAAFQKENGNRFIELEHFVTQILAVEYRFASENTIHTLLDANKTTGSNANFVGKEVWKQLQSLKAQAALELQSAIGEWREEARRSIDAVLKRLPEDLKKRDLDSGLEEKLTSSVHKLRDNLDNVTMAAPKSRL